MLPDGLVSTYFEYKKDTDSIASWLASTAKAAGFVHHARSVDRQPQANSGGRLKGKARKAAKKARDDAEASEQKYTIQSDDFARLAQFISKKAIPVPVSFRQTLDRVIAVRSKFGKRLEASGATLDPKDNDKHAAFVNVLKNVRTVLAPLMASNTLDEEPDPKRDVTNRFEGLKVHEPAEKFLNAPNIQRPEPSSTDHSTYEAEQPVSFVEALFAATALLSDMTDLRNSVQKIWIQYRDGDIDETAAAVATDIATGFVRQMTEEILPLMEPHGGIGKFIHHCYMSKCAEEDHPEEFVFRNINTIPNLDHTYEVADQTFLTSYHLLYRYKATLCSQPLADERPCNGDRVSDEDRVYDRTKMTGSEKYEDDWYHMGMSVIDLFEMHSAHPKWGVVDERFRGWKHMSRRKEIPAYLIFATQVFLDTAHALDGDVSRPYSALKRETCFMLSDINES